MLEYDRIDISEGVGAKKRGASKVCKICHYFKDIGFKYDPHFCSGYYGLMQKVLSFNDVAIVYVKENVYRIHFWYMSKDDAISIIIILIRLIKWEFYNLFFFIMHKNE